MSRDRVPQAGEAAGGRLILLAIVVLLAVPLGYLALVVAWEGWEWLSSFRILVEIALAGALLVCLGDL